jgi:hypothetical protein
VLFCFNIMTREYKGIGTQPEARGCIYACLGAEDPRSAVEELVGDVDTADDLDLLKIAEYALLKAPIIEGVERYLEDPFVYPAGRENSDPRELNGRVGVKVALRTRERLGEDPNLDLLDRINWRRVTVTRNMGDPHRALAIQGVRGKVDAAARSGVLTMHAAAVLNAAEIADSTGLQRYPADRDRFIEAVMGSGELPRAITRIHLKQVMESHTIITQHAMAINDGKRDISINKDMLRTDEEGVAHLSVPPKRWKHPIGGFIRSGGVVTVLKELGEQEMPDVQIGCLLSFDPIVTTSFYRHYVELMERYQAWPSEFGLKADS